MKKEKRSFFERLTGRLNLSGEDQHRNTREDSQTGAKIEKDDSEAQLAVDVYQTPTEIVVLAMIAGVKAEDLDISVTREMVIIKARREEPEAPEKERYTNKELYWGSFGRTIVLPDEVNADETEAIEKHGLLMIKMPKFNKNRSRSLKVKSL